MKMTCSILSSRAAAALGIVALSIPLLAVPGAARAEIITFASILSPENERPAVESDASGQGFFALDTDSNLFTWSITFEGLSTPNTVAHIHSQDPGTEPGEENGGVVIDLAAGAGDGGLIDGIGETSGIFFGSTTLSAEEDVDPFVGALLEGLWYANIHSGDNPGGELRGQIELGGVAVVPLPAAAWMLISALGVAGVMRKRRKAA